ncbi:MAG TPA: sigma 54-interacting transcriptional regulator [Polyangiaceae bacterium]|nr:sigma 54-interacting transcriptional regulator [Polyangiaceae bacterium]
MPAEPEFLRILTDGTAPVTGDKFFQLLARHAAEALDARYAFAAETLNPNESRSLAYWEGTGFGEGFSYRFPGTPCLRVAQGHVCKTLSGLREAFPEDVWLQQIGVDSYVGVPMRVATGEVLGHLAVLHTEPMDPTPAALAVLQIFASRGAVELQRVQTERALHEALVEVERLRDRLQAENVYLQDEIRAEHNFEELIGTSEPWQKLMQQVRSVAATNSTVLVAGETGVGKELIARALHFGSARRARPLVKVNCAAISAGLVESELFGHVKGAFTGAFEKRVGRFALADGGTIFLDEIGELPLDSQVRLLRVLQEQEFEPVGSSVTQRVDVRVIAATNRNLAECVENGTFRADLYFRLNVIPLEVPPLRERGSDITQLALHFLTRATRKTGKPIRGIGTAALEQMLRYAWPGNVRELENLIERAVVLSSGPALELASVFPSEPTGTPRAAAKSSAPPAPLASAATKPATIEEVERAHILSVLESTSWVIEGPRGAAQALNVSPSTIRSRMKRLGLNRG